MGAPGGGASGGGGRQPVRILVHIALPDLIELDADSALLQEWTARVRVQWAAARAAASQAGGDGGAWLAGGAAEAFACDAGITPVVTGEVHLAALDGLVRLCAELAATAPAAASPATPGTAMVAAPRSQPRPPIAAGPRWSGRSSAVGLPEPRSYRI